MATSSACVTAARPELEVPSSRCDLVTLSTVYSGGADTYDALWSPVILPPAESVVRALDLGKSTRVLDVGAGAGALTSALRAAAPLAAVVSVDAAPDMLRFGREHRGITAVLADAAALPVASASVHGVVLAYVLFHMLDPAAGLRESVRALTNEGRVGTVTWAQDWPSNADQLWTQSLEDLGVATRPAHSNYAGLETTEAIETLLVSVGLRLVRVWRQTLEHTFDAEEYWSMRAGHGSNRARLAALEPDARARVLAEVRKRLATLRPSDYAYRGEVICSVAEKASSSA